MPNIGPEQAAYLYRFAKFEHHQWREVQAALISCRPSDRLRALVEHALTVSGAEHRAAERRLFDVFDLVQSNLLEAGTFLAPAEHRRQLLARARHHDQIVAAVADEPTHAEMHKRLAAQLREAAAAIKIPPPAAAPPRPRRAHL